MARRSVCDLAWEMHEKWRKEQARKGKKGDKEPPAVDHAAEMRDSVRKVKADLRAKVLAQRKENPLRSEAYRRLVAMGDCEHCGVSGHSQAAHPPPTGKAIKQCDSKTFALCTVRPDGKGGLYEGCHVQFDQYRLFPTREEHERASQRWGAATQKRIYASGRWPKNMPVPARLERKKHEIPKQATAATAGASRAADLRQAGQRAAAVKGGGRQAGRGNASSPAKPAGRNRKQS